MSKKIVILNGSPRPSGNTSALVEAFTEGAEQAGHQVKHFILQQMDIHPCIGCYSGGKNPDSPCVQKDDMDTIYPAYKESDIIVMASPLYFWSISGQLKCALDRLFATVEGDPDFRIAKKDCVLLMAAEGNGYEETIQYYNGLMKHLGWNSLGMVLASHVTHIGDIKGQPVLDEARALGRSIT